VPTVWFVDTSVLVNLLDLDGFNQDKEAVAGELKRRLAANDTLILPITAIIETGNHIAHHGDGHHRRTVAEKFATILHHTRNGTAPWQLHSVQWDSAFLEHVITGASTGMTLVEQAVNRMGCGDLCVLAEREAYRRRSGIRDVKVWSLDIHLRSHA
jgi:hypothetical protein